MRIPILYIPVIFTPNFFKFFLRFIALLYSIYFDISHLPFFVSRKICRLTQSVTKIHQETFFIARSELGTNSLKK